MKKLCVYISISIALIQLGCSPICNKKAMTIAPIATRDTLNDNWIARKYAPLMGISPDSILKSIRIYHFINRWYESPYYLETKYGINDQTFAQKFYEDIYIERIPESFSMIRTSKKMLFFKQYTCIQQGDILLFQELSQDKKVVMRVVGVYLTNGKFVLCSPRTGKVIIEQFYDAYWFKRFLKAGRLKKLSYI